MRNLKSEKQLAFEKHTLAHVDALYRLGMTLTGDAKAADDLIQETYLKAYRSWDKYGHVTNIRTWLFRILRNSFINVYRKGATELMVNNIREDGLLL